VPEGDTHRKIYLRTLCFIRDGDRMLLLRRRNPPNQGLYNAPGGKIESHEDPYDACLREVHEETGIRLPGARLRALLTVITQTTGAQWLLFVFTADRPPGAAGPIATDEGDLAWVTSAEISSLPVPADIPLILPHLFTPQPGVLMGKIHAENDEADSLLDYEFRRA
jgi:8-oxo-dGTP diphosphatase